MLLIKRYPLLPPFRWNVEPPTELGPAAIPTPTYATVDYDAGTVTLPAGVVSLQSLLFTLGVIEMDLAALADLGQAIGGQGPAADGPRPDVIPNAGDLIP